MVEGKWEKVKRRKIGRWKIALRSKEKVAGGDLELFFLFFSADSYKRNFYSL